MPDKIRALLEEHRGGVIEDAGLLEGIEDFDESVKEPEPIEPLILDYTPIPVKTDLDKSLENLGSSVGELISVSVPHIMRDGRFIGWLGMGLKMLSEASTNNPYLNGSNHAPWHKRLSPKEPVKQRAVFR